MLTAIDAQALSCPGQEEFTLLLGTDTEMEQLPPQYEFGLAQVGYKDQTGALVSVLPTPFHNLGGYGTNMSNESTSNKRGQVHLITIFIVNI